MAKLFIAPLVHPVVPLRERYPVPIRVMSQGAGVVPDWTTFFQVDAKDRVGLVLPVDWIGVRVSDQLCFGQCRILDDFRLRVVQGQQLPSVWFPRTPHLLPALSPWLAAESPRLLQV